jgi:hypothetical protein
MAPEDGLEARGAPAPTLVGPSSPAAPPPDPPVGDVRLGEAQPTTHLGEPVGAVLGDESPGAESPGAGFDLSTVGLVGKNSRGNCPCRNCSPYSLVTLLEADGVALP